MKDAEDATAAKLGHVLGVMPELLTVGEVAGVLNIGASSVWRHVSRGDLPKPIRIGGSTRWRRAEIEALLNREAA